MDATCQNINTQKLLIVDDDYATRILIHGILEDKNLNIIEACSGKEALSLFKKYSKEIGLVLLDIKLQDCSGWDLIKQLKCENPVIPIIALSATIPTELEERCKSAGFDSYLSKPFDIGDLVQIVEFYLERQPIHP